MLRTHTSVTSMPQCWWHVPLSLQCHNVDEMYNYHFNGRMLMTHNCHFKVTVLMTSAVLTRVTTGHVTCSKLFMSWCHWTLCQFLSFWQQVPCECLVSELITITGVSLSWRLCGDIFHVSHFILYVKHYQCQRHCYSSISKDTHRHKDDVKTAAVCLLLMATELSPCPKLSVYQQWNCATNTVYWGVN